MTYMLDTNICIYIINRRPQRVFNHFKTLSAGSIGISSITQAEMYYGAEKSSKPQINKKALFQFFFIIFHTSIDISYFLFFQISGFLRVLKTARTVISCSSSSIVK